MSKHLSTAAAVLLAGTMLSAGAANAAVAVFQNNLAGFNAAAGNPAVAIDFESVPADITGNIIAGVTFSSPDGNALKVVAAASTFTNPLGFGIPDGSPFKLPATSGVNVLSPGGIELVPGSNIKQKDSLQLDFANGLGAFGMDVLFQSLDCCSFANYTVYDGVLNVLASGSLNTIANPGNAGGSWFLGFVSDFTDIRRIVITDLDDNAENPDSNLGYDTFRFGAGGSGAPEPASWALMIAGFGLAGAALRRTHRRVAA